MNEHIGLYEDRGSGAQRHVGALPGPLTAREVVPGADVEPERERVVDVSVEGAYLLAHEAFMAHVTHCYQCSHIGVNCAEADELGARMNTAREAAFAERAGQS
jgi:hypothetical protein